MLPLETNEQKQLYAYILPIKNQKWNEYANDYNTHLEKKIWNWTKTRTEIWLHPQIKEAII